MQTPRCRDRCRSQGDIGGGGLDSQNSRANEAMQRTKQEADNNATDADKDMNDDEYVTLCRSNLLDQDVEA